MIQNALEIVQAAAEPEEYQGNRDHEQSLVKPLLWQLGKNVGKAINVPAEKLTILVKHSEWQSHSDRPNQSHPVQGTPPSGLYTIELTLDVKLDRKTYVVNVWSTSTTDFATVKFGMSKDSRSAQRVHQLRDRDIKKPTTTSFIEALIRICLNQDAPVVMDTVSSNEIHEAVEGFIQAALNNESDPDDSEKLLGESYEVHDVSVASFSAITKLMRDFIGKVTPRLMEYADDHGVDHLPRFRDLGYFFYYEAIGDSGSQSFEGDCNLKQTGTDDGEHLLSYLGHVADNYRATLGRNFKVRVPKGRDIELNLGKPWST